MQTTTLNEKIEGFLKRYLIQRNVTFNTEELKIMKIDGDVFDSLFQIELILFLEKEFSIDMRQEFLVPENFKSLDTVVTFVKSKIDQ